MSGAGGNEVPPAAASAWQAYRSMLTSKRAHVELLEHIERNRNDGIAPTFAETARLAQLLETHDESVREFAAQNKRLAASDPVAHRKLIDAMSAVSELEMGSDSQN